VCPLERCSTSKQFELGDVDVDVAFDVETRLALASLASERLRLKFFLSILV